MKSYSKVCTERTIHGRFESCPCGDKMKEVASFRVNVCMLSLLWQVIKDPSLK